MRPELTFSEPVQLNPLQMSIVNQASTRKTLAIDTLMLAVTLFGINKFVDKAA
jgi:hypothetical protein